MVKMENPEMSAKKLKDSFTALYAATGEERPQEMASQELEAMYRRAGESLVADLDMEKRAEVEEELMNALNEDELLSILSKHFEAEVVGKKLGEVATEFVGAWLSGVLPEMPQEKVLELRQTLIDLGNELGIINQETTNG